MYHFFSSITFLFLIPLTLFSNDELYTVNFDCVIQPSRIAEVGSSAVGIINDIKVDRNDDIKRGSVIAILNNTTEKAKVDVAKKRALMQSKIKLSKINLALAKREQQRVQKAFNRGSASAHDLDIADTELLLSKVKKLQAIEENQLAKKELVHAQSVLAQRTVHAPFSGVIVERHKEVGEHIDTEAIVTLAQIDPLYVEVILPISKLGLVSKGMQAQVSCTSLKECKRWVATVEHVDKVMDAASGTFGVRLLLPNPKHEIPAGIRSDLKFLLPTPKK